jgi:hypothetical protein
VGVLVGPATKWVKQAAAEVLVALLAAGLLLQQLVLLEQAPSLDLIQLVLQEELHFMDIYLQVVAQVAVQQALASAHQVKQL